MSENHQNKTDKQTDEPTNRRKFIGKLAGFGFSAAVLGAINFPVETFGQKIAENRNSGFGSNTATFRRRALASANLRRDAANRASLSTSYYHPTNGDEGVICQQNRKFQ